MISFVKTSSMDLLMAYYFAFKEGRLPKGNGKIFTRIRQEIQRRAEGCIVVYKEKRA